MVKASPDTPSREARLKAGLAYGGRPLDVSLAPWMPTNLQSGLLRRHVPALVRAALQATARFVREPSFRARFGYGSLQEECILKDPGYEPDIPLGRLDGFLKDESLQFLEFNTDGAADGVCPIGLDEHECTPTRFALVTKRRHSLVEERPVEVAHRDQHRDHGLRDHGPVPPTPRPRRGSRPRRPR